MKRKSILWMLSGFLLISMLIPLMGCDKDDGNDPTCNVDDSGNIVLNNYQGKLYKQAPSVTNIQNFKGWIILPEKIPSLSSTSVYILVDTLHLNEGQITISSESSNKDSADVTISGTAYFTYEGTNSEGTKTRYYLLTNNPGWCATPSSDPPAWYFGNGK
jgi:hypothetical protein